MDSIVQSQIGLPSMMELDGVEASSVQFLSGDDKIAREVREYFGQVLAEYLRKKGRDMSTSRLLVLDFLVSMLGKYSLTLSNIERTHNQLIAALGFLPLSPKDELPTTLKLKSGEIRELTEGVFIKKQDNGILELYVSQR
ncbi:MAG: hypothetical protein WB661_01235 [Candidatus Bathyarchaeia archaeon]